MQQNITVSIPTLWLCSISSKKELGCKSILKMPLLLLAILPVKQTQSTSKRQQFNSPQLTSCGGYICVDLRFRHGIGECYAIFKSRLYLRSHIIHQHKGKCNKMTVEVSTEFCFLIICSRLDWIGCLLYCEKLKRETSFCMSCHSIVDTMPEFCSHCFASFPTTGRLLIHQKCNGF